MKDKKELAGAVFALCSETFDVDFGDMCDWTKRDDEDVKNAQDALIIVLQNKNLLSLREITEYLGAPDQTGILRALHIAESNTDRWFIRDKERFIEMVESMMEGDAYE